MSPDKDRHTMELPLPELVEITAGSGSLASGETEKSDSASDSVRYLTDPRLFESTGVKLAFTTRHGGLSLAPYEGLNLSTRVDDDLDTVLRNRQILLDSIGMGHLAAKLVNPIQVHSDSIAAVLPHSRIEDFRKDIDVCGLEGVEILETPLQPVLTEEVDAVLSSVADVPVMLLFADCVPVVIVAPDGSYCVVHSGWRGTVKSISAKAAMALSVASDYPAESMNAYIGPHIGACCYEVGDDMIDTFVSEFGSGCDAFGNHLDLEYAVVSALVSAGLDHERIVSADICTAENTQDYFSYRAENGQTGRFAALCCRLEQ